MGVGVANSKLPGTPVLSIYPASALEGSELALGSSRSAKSVPLGIGADEADEELISRQGDSADFAATGNIRSKHENL